jgi:hypothetical protein
MVVVMYQFSMKSTLYAALQDTPQYDLFRFLNQMLIINMH